jgi:hypothetical protein
VQKIFYQEKSTRLDLLLCESGNNFMTYLKKFAENIFLSDIIICSPGWIVDLSKTAYS